jgi:predicted phage terminase large subunit-like protein
VNQWYDHTLYSRLNNKSKGCIIIIMQRLHEDDLVGHVLEQEPWEMVRLPAIAEEDETHLIESRYQRKTVRRRAGEALHPEREPLEVLERLRHTLGEYNFAGQYQQAPAPLGGGLVKVEWFRRYVPGTEPSKFEMIIQSWDTANKCTELSDYSVCTTLGYKKKRFYVLHVLRQKLDYPELKRSVVSQAESYGATNILIEDKASGTQLIQELTREGLYGVTSYEPTMDKIMRLHSVSNTIENGFVFLPTDAEWLPVYLQELTTFPNGKNDDQADSISQALDWAKRGMCTYPVLEHMRRQAIREGLPIDPSLWDDDLLVAEGEPVKCRLCGATNPAQYGRTYRCTQCGYEWKDVRFWQQELEIPRCELETGEILVWDDGHGRWVDPANGDTYAPGS